MGMTNADEKKRVGVPRAAYIHTYITVHPLPVVPTYMVGFESDNPDYVISRRSGPKTSPLELGVVLTPLRLLPKAP